MPAGFVEQADPSFDAEAGKVAVRRKRRTPGPGDQLKGACSPVGIEIIRRFVLVPDEGLRLLQDLLSFLDGAQHFLKSLAVRRAGEENREEEKTESVEQFRVRSGRGLHVRLPAHSTVTSSWTSGLSLAIGSEPAACSEALPSPSPSGSSEASWPSMVEVVWNGS